MYQQLVIIWINNIKTNKIIKIQESAIKKIKNSLSITKNIKHLLRH